MSLVNGTTTVRRIGAPAEADGATASSLSQASSELSGAAARTGSPVMLDLNHDGVKERIE